MKTNKFTPVVFLGLLLSLLTVPAFAEDNLKARVTDLEHRVAVLEQVKAIIPQWSCGAQCGTIKGCSVSVYGAITGSGATAAEAMKNTQENCGSVLYVDIRTLEPRGCANVLVPPTLKDSCTRNY